MRVLLPAILALQLLVSGLRAEASEIESGASPSGEVRYQILDRSTLLLQVPRLEPEPRVVFETPVIIKDVTFSPDETWLAFSHGSGSFGRELVLMRRNEHGRFGPPIRPDLAGVLGAVLQARGLGGIRNLHHSYVGNLAWRADGRGLSFDYSGNGKAEGRAESFTLTDIGVLFEPVSQTATLDPARRGGGP